MGALVILREKVLRPILSATVKQKTNRKPTHSDEIDQHYEAVRQNMLILLSNLRLAA